jgi:hypothetical protein
VKVTAMVVRFDDVDAVVEKVRTGSNGRFEHFGE